MNATDAATIDVSQELDCIGMFCPMPIYKASLAMKKLQAGQVLKVLSTDLGSVADFPSFARQANHHLLATDEQEGVHIFFIRKGVN
jgi:tRNA 2-thiouridine synthesizing protein A